jgi:arylsulfatase A-like enzyme
MSGGIRVPGIVRWPDGGITGGQAIDRMVHMSDWFPTLLAAAGVQPPTDRTIDGVNVLPVLQGEDGEVCTRRFWQWNRYDPVPRCNAGMRDGDWKLVQPKLDEAFHMPEISWLMLAMYGPEYFEHYGVFSTGYPPREIPDERPSPELYNVAEDPLEQNDLAESNPDRVSRMCRDIEPWFEDVEAERGTIDDDWWPDGQKGQIASY